MVKSNSTKPNLSLVDGQETVSIDANMDESSRIPALKALFRSACENDSQEKIDTFEYWCKHWELDSKEIERQTKLELIDTGVQQKLITPKQRISINNKILKLKSQHYTCNEIAMLLDANGLKVAIEEIKSGAKASIDANNVSSTKTMVKAFETVTNFRLYISQQKEKAEQLKAEITDMEKALDDGQMLLDFSDPENPKITNSSGDDLEEEHTASYLKYSKKISTCDDPDSAEKIRNSIYKDSKLTADEVEELIEMLESE